MLTAGAQAPSFTLTDPAGHRHSLTQILERGAVLLAFYKISCPVCQLTMPYLQRLVNGSLQIVGISQDDERGTERFQMKLGLTMATLLDLEEDGYPASNAFGITHVPSLFLVETDRRISLASSGFNKHDLEAIARRAESRIFLPEDNVPEWKAG
jgi:peroxiredoxin